MIRQKLVTRKELKGMNATDYKNGDTIQVSKYLIEIEYGNFSKPSLRSKVFDLKLMRYQDVVFRPDYIDEFLHK